MIYDIENILMPVIRYIGAKVVWSLATGSILFAFP